MEYLPVKQNWRAAMVAMAVVVAKAVVKYSNSK